MADLRPPRSRFRDGEWLWMLTLRVAGRDVRFVSGEPVDVPSRTVGTLRYGGGMATAGLARTLDMFADVPSERSASFQVVLDFDLAQEIERGHLVHAATGELAQWRIGDNFEDRRIILAGELRQPAYGYRDEGFAFTLQETLGEDRGRFLEPSEIVGQDTFPSGDVTGSEDVDHIWGVGYTIVIGAPGGGVTAEVAGTTIYTDLPGAPVLLVEQQQPSTAVITDYRFFLCRGIATGIGSTIDVYNATDRTKDTTAILAVAQDKLGRDYTFGEPANSADIPGKTDALFTAWYDRTATPQEIGSTPSPHSTRSLRRASDVLRWALSLSTLRIDRSQLGRLRALAGIHVDTYINDPELSPWVWIRDVLLPLLPASAVSGPDGLYIAAWNYGATAEDATGPRLEVGRNCERSPNTPVVYSDEGDVVNEITLQWALDASTGQYTRRKTIGAQWVDGTNQETHPSIWAKRSQALFGKRTLSIEGPWVYDEATADVVMQALMRRHALPVRRLAVMGGPELEWARPGDVSLLTDAELFFTNRPVHIETVRSSDDGLVEIGLVVFDQLGYPDG